MSEFPSKKKAEDYLSTLMLSNFIFFSSFIISHPLYFAYFIFFSPYLFKILSFLSPLFATTSLLLLAIFTLTPSILLHGSSFQLPPSFLLSTYQDDFSCFQILQAFQLALDVEIIPVEEEEEEIPQEGEDHRKVPEVKQVKNLVAFFQEKEKLSGKKQVKTTNTVTDKGEEFLGSKALEGEKGDVPPTFTTPVSTDDPRSRLRSASSWGSENGDGKQRLNNKLKEKNFSQPLESYSENVGTSLRRGEKEWRRTLACKLFEERNHGVDGAEGMDLLWETYETETAAAKKKPSPSPSPSPSSHFRNGSKKKGKNSRGTSYSVSIDEEEDESDGPLCCLQAFKLSAGKMNLGMGRPGIVKITKALKGFGWLHHNVVASASPRRTKKSNYHHSI